MSSEDPREPSLASPSPAITELVTVGGCACKVAPGRLDAILEASVSADEESPRWLGDATAFAIDDTAMCGSVDVGTPIVDDVRTWAEITVSNAVSDIYAVGGVPEYALMILGWPHRLSVAVGAEVVEAARAALAAEKAVFGGGHTIASQEPLLGFAVIGAAAAAPMSANAFRVGDVVCLTKSIGTGILVAGLRMGIRVEDEWMAGAISSMKATNRDASRAALAAGLSGCTDVSGYGLLGACWDAAFRSGVAIALDAPAVQVLPGTIAMLDEGAVPARAEETREWLDVRGAIDGERDLTFELLAAGPETSGGLLLSVPPKRYDGFREAAYRFGLEVWQIGEVLSEPARIVLREPPSADGSPDT